MKKEFPSPQELMLKREFPGNNHSLENDMNFNETEYDDLPVSSSTDCTGLIASAPVTEEEVESYLELQHFLPKNYVAKKKSVKHRETGEN